MPSGVLYYYRHGTVAFQSLHFNSLRVPVFSFCCFGTLGVKIRCAFEFCYRAIVSHTNWDIKIEATVSPTISPRVIAAP